MLKINCDKCHKELNEPGGLLFGPPRTKFTTEGFKDENNSRKTHLCLDCYHAIAKIIFEKSILENFCAIINSGDSGQFQASNIKKSVKKDETRYC